MKSRRQAREVALQALYQWDCVTEHNGGEAPALSSTLAHFFTEEAIDLQQDNFLHELYNGVIEHHQEIDEVIAISSLHWSVQRMCRVDRNILRIAVFEMLYLKDIPVSVTINEAIEIGKRFGGDDSGPFINGVLDHVAKTIEKSEKKTEQEKTDLLHVVNE